MLFINQSYRLRNPHNIWLSIRSYFYKNKATEARDNIMNFRYFISIRLSYYIFLTSSSLKKGEGLEKVLLSSRNHII